MTRVYMDTEPQTDEHDCSLSMFRAYVNTGLKTLKLKYTALNIQFSPDLCR